MIRLFACDLDGTLLNENHEFDDMILNTMNYVISKERYFSIATGRHMHIRQREELKMNGINCFIVCMNGALILDSSFHEIYKKQIDSEIVKDILTQFPEIHFECIGIDKVYTLSSKENYILNMKKSNNWALISKKLDKILESYQFDLSIEDIVKEEILKINCRIFDQDATNKLNTYLNLNSDKIVNAPFQNDFFEITSKSVNKGEAVGWLAKQLHLSEDEVAVYGDSSNDLEMLRRFKHSYATANANEFAKEAASKTIGYCKDHAVPKHILDTINKEN